MKCVMDKFKFFYFGSNFYPRKTSLTNSIGRKDVVATTFHIGKVTIQLFTQSGAVKSKKEHY